MANQYIIIDKYYNKELSPSNGKRVFQYSTPGDVHDRGEPMRFATYKEAEEFIVNHPEKFTGTTSIEIYPAPVKYIVRE